MYEELPIKLGQCGKLALNYCEDTLVQADAPASAAAKLKITLDGFGAVLPPPPVPVALFDDFDIFIFKSDAAGKVGEFAGTGGEGAGTPEVVTVENASGFYLVRVVYYAVLNAGYMGTAELIGAPKTVATQLTPTTPPQNAPASSPGKPKTLPVSGKLSFSFAADKGKRKTARKRGIRVRVRCSVQCRTTAVAKVSKKVAKALRLGRKRTIKLGRGRATITRAGRIPFFVKLNKKAKRSLARKKVKKFKVTFVITVKDLSGKQFKKGKRKITLR